jgi:nucleotide-binding universal stress UspA family protein
MDPRARRTLVLVPVDFSPTSSEALQRAGAWACQAPVDLDVIHVVERGSGDAGGGKSSLPHYLAALERHAVDQVAGLKSSGGEPLALRHHVALGEPWAEITRLAHSLSADLIVMGAPAARRGDVGAIARNLAQSAPCPVVVVTRASRDAPGRATVLGGRTLDDAALAAATQMGLRQWVDAHDEDERGDAEAAKPKV